MRIEPFEGYTSTIALALIRGSPPVNITKPLDAKRPYVKSGAVFETTALTETGPVFNTAVGGVAYNPESTIVMLRIVPSNIFGLIVNTAFETLRKTVLPEPVAPPPETNVECVNGEVTVKLRLLVIEETCRDSPLMLILSPTANSLWKLVPEPTTVVDAAVTVAVPLIRVFVAGTYAVGNPVYKPLDNTVTFTMNPVELT